MSTRNCCQSGRGLPSTVWQDLLCSSPHL